MSARPETGRKPGRGAGVRGPCQPSRAFRTRPGDWSAPQPPRHSRDGATGTVGRDETCAAIYTKVYVTRPRQGKTEPWISRADTPPDFGERPASCGDGGARRDGSAWARGARFASRVKDRPREMNCPIASH